MQVQFEWLKAQFSTQQTQIDEINVKLNSSEFAHAVVLAGTEAQAGTTQEKIEEMASVLVRSLAPSSEADYSDDLTSFIRDVINLSHKDMQVLRLLADIYSDVIRVTPNLNSPNVFTEKMDILRAAVDRSMHRDDFYAHCVRLGGFGLVIEVVRNTSRMAPEDYCFRPTRRGLRFLQLLGEQNSGTDPFAARSSTAPVNSRPSPDSGLRESARIIVAPISSSTSQAEYSLKAVDGIGVVIELGNGLPVRVPRSDYIESRDEVTGKPKLLLTRKYFQGYFPGHEHAEEYFLPR